MSHYSSELLLNEISRQGDHSAYWLKCINDTVLQLSYNRLMKNEDSFIGASVNVSFGDSTEMNLKIKSCFVPDELKESGKVWQNWDNNTGSVWFRPKLEFELQPTTCIQIGDAELYIFCDLDQFMLMI